MSHEGLSSAPPPKQEEPEIEQPNPEAKEGNREVVGVEPFRYKILELPKKIFVPEFVPRDSEDPSQTALNCTSFVKMVLRKNGIILPTEVVTTVEDIYAALNQGRFSVEESSFNAGVECQKIFEMRSTTPYAPQMQYDHIGFELPDGRLMDMSGHRYKDGEPLPPKIYKWEELSEEVDGFGQKILDTTLADPEIAKSTKFIISE